MQYICSYSWHPLLPSLHSNTGNCNCFQFGFLIFILCACGTVTKVSKSNSNQFLTRQWLTFPSPFQLLLSVSDFDVFSSSTAMWSIGKICIFAGELWWDSDQKCHPHFPPHLLLTLTKWFVTIVTLNCSLSPRRTIQMQMQWQRHLRD